MKNVIPKISGLLGIVSGGASAVTAVLYPHKAGMNALFATLSLFLVLVFFISYFDVFMQFSRKRSTRMGLNSIVMICSFLFIIILANLIARQYYLRADWSSTARYSLSPQTKDVVRRLDHPVRVTVFSQENTAPYKKAIELLEGYRYVNPNIVFSVVDLDREPILAREHGIGRYNMAFVKGMTAEIVSEGIDEQTITNAIINVTRKTRQTVYFTSGHGEHDASSEGREGMSKAAARLTSIGYRVKALQISGIDAVPADAGVVIIAGPRASFPVRDAKKLETFLSGGGKVLALLDPGYDPDLISGKAGIGLGAGIIIDPASNLGGRNEAVPLVSTYQESPATRDFRLSTAYPEAAPLQLSKKKSYDYITIVQTPPTSRLVNRGKVIDSGGNYIMAAAAGSKNGRDILVVFGDSDFASNGSFAMEGNGNLFLNCVNWLAGEAELVSIAPTKDDFVPLYLAQGQNSLILVVSLVLLPGAVVFSGALVWWRRHRL